MMATDSRTMPREGISALSVLQMEVSADECLYG